MVGLLITGHGHFATGLGSSLRLITGNTENIEYVDFEADHSTETLAHNLNQAFDKLKNCDGVLVLSDLAGGSPFKTAVECKFARPEQAIEVIAGSNLPMLIEGSMSMGIYENPLDMAEALIPTGKDYIIRFELAEHNDDTEEDGI
ncbi:PTS fructose transporter subunit IIA [Anaerosacchariphilus sp. NSJ-68]|mgnify:FL=1|uniref:PTS fructose transporter subunit IIA n=2 Tax=Lachnospiraceae TaxID=186803 RepID=A0A923L9X9_9FIRM|nr:MULTISPECIES: PTS fructose transporter subunit IIA [Lachnospiraceae]MBC5658437.1 PTS fructose transporter subunit IIA [Anaerosacchariphilus hominis]MBC5698353.1 PTS fructose transporter subunit IIA [Roseburia difficilis]